MRWRRGREWPEQPGWDCMCSRRMMERFGFMKDEDIGGWGSKQTSTVEIWMHSSIVRTCDEGCGCSFCLKEVDVQNGGAMRAGYEATWSVARRFFPKTSPMRRIWAPTPRSFSSKCS